MVGALGSFSTQFGSVQRELLTGRAEACPVRLGNPRVGLRPCGMVELGVTRATLAEPVGVSATSLWWAPGLGVRAELGVSRAMRLEATVSALAPLPRHEISVAESPAYRDAIVTFSGELGASFSLP